MLYEVITRHSGFMTWDQIRTLRDAGVTIAAHSHTHAHLAAKSDADARSYNFV